MKNKVKNNDDIKFLENTIKNINNYIVFIENKKDDDLEEAVNYLYEMKSQITNKVKKIVLGEIEEISEEERLLFSTNTPKDVECIIKYLNKNKQFEELQKLLQGGFYLKGANLQGGKFLNSFWANINLSGLNLSNVNLKGV